jgi:hypothetical protein
MPTGQCRFCGQSKPLIRAHIVPRSLYPIVEPHGRRKIMSSSTPNERAIQLQNGLYDDSLVCADCEGIWDKYDAYAKRFFVDNYAQGQEVGDGKGARGLIFTGADHRLIKLFFLSVLWRCHATSRPEFSNVHLGPYEARLKAMLIDGDAGDVDDFSVAIQDRRHPVLGPIWFNPCRTRVLGRTCYEISLFGPVGYIKVDSQSWGKPLRGACLGSSPDVRVVLHDLASPNCQYMQLAYKMVANSERARHSSRRT